jgi:hypothetical protein
VFSPACFSAVNDFIGDTVRQKPSIIAAFSQHRPGEKKLERWAPRAISRGESVAVLHRGDLLPKSLDRDLNEQGRRLKPSGFQLKPLELAPHREQAQGTFGFVFAVTRGLGRARAHAHSQFAAIGDAIEGLA